jgi:hypothetical protein
LGQRYGLLLRIQNEYAEKLINTHLIISMILHNFGQKYRIVCYYLSLRKLLKPVVMKPEGVAWQGLSMLQP